MSLSWRSKPVRIGLGPDRIFVSGAKTLDLAANDGSWAAAVDALPEVFSGRHGEAQIVIADQFVRYALLPWNETLRTPDQWVALAKHRFMALHGPRAAEWDVKVTETAPNGPRLACAVDRALIEKLADNAVASNVRLISVQPFLVAAFNRIRRHVGNGNCWIVVEEPGRLTLALIQRGAWVAIRSRRSDRNWRQVLPEILEREAAFLGLSQPVTRVIVCAQDDQPLEPNDAWRAESLDYRSIALAPE